MKKRPAASLEPIDIFDSPRFERAMAGATAVEPPPAPKERLLPVQQKEEAKDFQAEPKTVEPVHAKPAKQKPPKASKSRRNADDSANGVSSALPVKAQEQYVTLRFQVPTSVRADFQLFMAELSSTLDVRLSDSNVARSYLEILLHEYRERILARAAEARGTLRRPPLSDTIAMAEFDDALGAIFREAFRQRPCRVPPSAG